MTKLRWTPTQTSDRYSLRCRRLPLSWTSFVEAPPVDLVKLVGEVAWAVWDPSWNLLGYDLF